MLTRHRVAGDGRHANVRGAGHGQSPTRPYRHYERPEVVASLRESGLSLRAIAAATGNDTRTIQGDLRSGVKDSHTAPLELARNPRPTGLALAHLADNRPRSCCLPLRTYAHMACEHSNYIEAPRDGAIPAQVRARWPRHCCGLRRWQRRSERPLTAP